MEMYALDKKIFLLIFLIPILSSCAAKDVTINSFAKTIADKCFQLTKDLTIYEVQGSDKDKVSSFTSSYLMVGDPSEKQRFIKKGKAVGTIVKGEKLLITKVVDFPYGSAGRCWVVKARYNKNDPLIEIPSCWVWEQPIWVEPLSPIEQQKTDKKLQIKAEQLKEVGRENCSAIQNKNSGTPKQF